MAVIVLQTKDRFEASSHICDAAYHQLRKGSFIPELQMINRAHGTGYDLSLAVSSLLLTKLAGTCQAFLSRTEAPLLEQMAVSALVTIHRLFNRDQDKQAICGMRQTSRNGSQCIESVSNILSRGTPLTTYWSMLPPTKLVSCPTITAQFPSTSFTIRCPSISSSDGPRLTLVAFSAPCKAERPTEEDPEVTA